MRLKPKFVDLWGRGGAKTWKGGAQESEKCGVVEESRGAPLWEGKSGID